MTKLTIIAAVMLAASLLPTKAAGAAANRKATAQLVLDKLYQAAGQLHLKVPKLHIAKDNKKVATYHPAQHAITLDELAMQVCFSLGKDSLNALAFILGHELSHAFQTGSGKGKHATNFLAFDRASYAHTRTEKTADIQGAFTAYLAGYSLKTAVPKLLPELYKAYNLSEHQLPGYPPLEERQRTATEVLKITGDLIDLFETANYLAVAGRYDLAAESYAYILRHYQGRELYNNLGTMYLLAAMDIYQSHTDRFVHPVEMDADSPLKKIEKARGERELTALEQRIRTNLLVKAVAAFEQAARLDKNYHTAKLNLACAMNMMEKPAAALAFLEESKFAKAAARNPDLLEKTWLAKGISLALLHQFDAADQAFAQVAQSGRQALAAQATFNQDMLYTRPASVTLSNCFLFPPDFTEAMQAIPLGRTSGLPALDIVQDSLFLRRRDDGPAKTFSFADRTGNLLSVVRFRNTLAPQFNLLDLPGPLDRAFFQNMVTTSSGYYLKSSDNAIVLMVNGKGEVVEIARIWVH